MVVFAHFLLWAGQPQKPLGQLLQGFVLGGGEGWLTTHLICGEHKPPASVLPLLSSC